VSAYTIVYQYPIPFTGTAYIVSLCASLHPLFFSVDKNLNFFSPLPSYQVQYIAVVLVA